MFLWIWPIIGQKGDQMKELRRYLQSKKFSEDTTVQVSDVLQRLENVKPDVDKEFLEVSLTDENREGILIGLQACGFSKEEAAEKLCYKTITIYGYQDYNSVIEHQDISMSDVKCIQHGEVFLQIPSNGHWFTDMNQAKEHLVYEVQKDINVLQRKIKEIRNV